MAVVHRVDGMRLWEADLACPVCGAEFHIEQGVGAFNTDPVAGSSRDVSATGIVQAAPDVIRMAAQLGVLGGHAPVLLAGRYALAAEAYAALTGAPVVVVLFADDVATVSPAAVAPEAGVSLLRIGRRLPLGAGTLAAAAFDQTFSSSSHASEMVAQTIRAVRSGGRILVPISYAPPFEQATALRRVAQDDAEWVGEVTAEASGLVTLRRQPPVV